MNNELDLYLKDVGVQLDSLSPERRDEELHEMRHHLESIIARLVNSGLSEPEATEAAMAQFGGARNLGCELRRAHQEPESLGRFVSAAVGAMVFYLLLLPPYKALRELPLLDGWTFGGVQPQYYAAVYWLIPFAACALAGCVSVSRAGRVAACIGVAVVALLSAPWLCHPGLDWIFRSYDLLWMLFFTSLGARLGSRRILRLSIESH